VNRGERDGGSFDAKIVANGLLHLQGFCGRKCPISFDEFQILLQNPGSMVVGGLLLYKSEVK